MRRLSSESCGATPLPAGAPWGLRWGSRRILPAPLAPPVLFLFSSPHIGPAGTTHKKKNKSDVGVHDYVRKI